MRRLLLAAVLALALAQAYAAVQWSRYAWVFTSARRLDGTGAYSEALERMERAVRIRPSVATARAEAGDIAQHALDDSRSVRSAEEERKLLRRAWAGYAGSVTVAPLDAWSWSGLAEVAIREAQRVDRLGGVSLNDIEERS